MFDHNEHAAAVESSTVFAADKATIANPHRDFKPLASPTTPFQFETRMQQGSQHHGFYDHYHRHHQQQQQQHCYYYENPSMLNDAARIHSSIQLQLESYIRGIQQGAGNQGLVLQQQQQQQQQAARSIPQSFQQQHHPTIALLQQRFQRLERDKETRQSKQLYRSSQELQKFSSIAATSTFPSSSSSSVSSLSSSSPPSSSPSSSSSTSQLAAAPVHHSSSIAAGHRFPAFPVAACHSISPFVLNRHCTRHPCNEEARLGLDDSGGGGGGRVLLSLLPVLSDRPGVVPAATAPPDSTEDRGFHKGWKASIVIDDEEDVDTSLHL